MAITGGRLLGGGEQLLRTLNRVAVMVTSNEAGEPRQARDEAGELAVCLEEELPCFLRR